MSDLLCASPRCKPPGRHGTDCRAEPDKPCRGCLPARAADGLRLCTYETNKLAEHPAEAAELYAELGLALVGQSVADGIHQKNPGQGLNLNQKVVNHRTLIRHRLVSWTLLVCQERGFTLPRDTVGELGRFLSRQASWLAAQDFAGDAVDELAELVELGRSLRQSSQTRTIKIGPCPRTVEHDGEQRACPGTVRALLRSQASLLPSAIQCDEDEDHAWDSTQWAKLGRHMPKKEDPMRLRPAPKTLQERLGQTRADYAEEGVKDRFPVAVSINGAKPVYGEFSQVVEEDDRLTRFGSTAREFVTSFAWSLTVEQRIDWSDRPLEVRFGEEKQLSYEGSVRTDAVSHDGSVSRANGGWTTKLLGLGELKRYGHVDEAEGKIAA